LTAKLGLRAVSLILLAAAAVAGLGIRIAHLNVADAAAPFAGIQSLDLSEGQSVGNARFEGITQNDFPSLQLRLTGCSEPVYAMPLQLTAVSIPADADQVYAGFPHYASTDVYRGQVRQNFSHLSRVIARGFVDTYNLETGYYVRFYAPTDCGIREDDFVELTRAILKLRPRLVQADDASRAGPP
jgi:hypothetical protein